MSDDNVKKRETYAMIERDNAMTEGKIEYLQMLQEPIGRMSTMSAIIKGFAATIVVGILGMARNEADILFLVLSLLVVIVLAFIDAHYLQYERRFRFLFNQVRLGKRALDFSMEITNDPKEIADAKAGTWACILALHNRLFYGVLTGTIAIALVRNAGG